MNHFTCGHESTSDFYGFGRGQARQRRIAEHLNRKCYYCAMRAIEEHVHALTTQDGQPLKTANPAAFAAAWVKGEAKVESDYWCETLAYRLARAK